MTIAGQADILASHNQDPLAMFQFAMRAAETKRAYMSKLKAFFDFMELKGEIEDQARQFVIIATSDSNAALASVMRFISFQRERVARKEIAEATLRNYHKPIKLFCEMNDVQINWKKVTRGLPRISRASNDRAPTLDEIKKLTEYPDRRIKPIIYTMVSSGIRLGAWDYLKWGDITPVMEGDVIVAAKMVVYRGNSEQYLTFMTVEAYNALKEWMDYRAMAGEAINKDSWVMRDLWDAVHYHHGLGTHPQRLKSSGIKRLMERALWAQGIRRPLENGSRRHEFQADHGLRKFFKTHSEQVMKPINVEILMGHSTGISDSYYKPTETEMLQDYLRAEPLLSVSDEASLRAKNTKLEQQIEVENRRLTNSLEKVEKRLDYQQEYLADVAHTLRTIGLPKPDDVPADDWKLKNAAAIVEGLADQLQKLAGDKQSKLEQEEKEWLERQKSAHQ